jgi:hypothetical protein
MAAAIRREFSSADSWLKRLSPARQIKVRDEITPLELEMFEAYWIEQFTGLLNTSAANRSACSPTAQKIVDAIRSEIRSLAL